MLSNGSCVLIGITVTEMIFAIVYYAFLRYLFKNFDKKYENKEVVKTFKSEHEVESLRENENEDGSRYKTVKKILSYISLTVRVISLIYILYLPIFYNDYELLLMGIACLVVCTISIYLITKLSRPIVSLLGFIISTVVLFIFIHNYGNESILWFILAETLIVLIILLTNRMK